MTARAENVTSSPNRLRKRTARPKGKIFTVKEIQSLRPEGAEGEHYYVTGPKGLAIRVLKSGVKTFYFKYTLNHKKDQVFLGNFAEKPEKSDEITLAMATEKHTEFLSLVNKGINPKAPVPVPVPAPVPEASYATMTVEELAKVYIKFMQDPEMRADSTSKENERTINTYILPFFKDKGLSKLTDIKKSHAAQLVNLTSKNAETNKKTPGQARGVLKVARAMFNYQIEREDDYYKNPFSKLGKLPDIKVIMKTRKQRRRLKEKEIFQFWSTLNSETGPGSASAARALMLTLVTGQRPGEVASMHRSEIEGDLWIIPAARIKTRCQRWEDHLVPLSPLAMKIIGNFQGYIFPSPAPGYEGEPITEDALSQLVNDERVGKDKVVTRPRWLGLSKKWTPNDLRKTARTMLAEIGCPDEIAEIIVNHAIIDLKRTYNLHKYEKEKRDWLTKLSKELELLLAEETDTVRLSDETYNVQVLEELVAKMPLTEVAKQLNITDNAVRKRCKKHNIELKPRGWWLKGKARGW